MAEKFVLVTSFDLPEEDGDFPGLVEEVMAHIKPLVDHQANRHVWMGTRETADAVLNVIGVD